MSESVNTIVRDKFFSLFKSLEINITASGRANIIGEHTDYYGGYVLPFAIDKGIHFCASKSQNKDQIFSVDFQEMYQLEDKISTGSWKSYVASCIKEMKSEYEVGNIHLVFGGNIPIGAGLSSSSSLVCGIIEVYNHLFQLNISDIDKVNLASKVEHGAGVQGGKMDQYAIFFGKYKNALLLDCQSLINEPIPFDSSCSFLLINSMVKHNLVHTEKN
jgi:galactokinase